jgi:hypothetical protein
MHDHDFRQRYAPDETTLIKNCEVIVHLLTNPKEAKYQYSYTIQVMEGEPQTEWFHVIPSADWKVSSVSAVDNNGGLQTTTTKQSENKTKITVKFRRPIAVNEDYSFTFSYQAHIISLESPQFLYRSIVYTDSIYHANQCNRLIVKLNLPEKGVPVKSTPHADISSNPVTHEITGMRPLDDFTFLLAYKQRRVGKQFWITLATMFTSALIGALVRRFLF